MKRTLAVILIIAWFAGMFYSILMQNNIGLTFYTFALGGITIIALIDAVKRNL